MARDTAELAVVGLDSALDAAAERLLRSNIKRCIDIVLSGLGLVFLAPFLLVIGVLIAVESPGPILFRQRRTGHAGAPFSIYKFRTMRVVEDGDAVIAVRRSDFRITRIGAFLRRSGIDELPQLLNVLKGEMSLVGPRPHAVVHDRYYSATVSGYRSRFLVKPGISGLAQVSGLRGEITDLSQMMARLDADLEYIRQWSVSLDLWIMLRTLIVGPFDPQAY